MSSSRTSSWLSTGVLVNELAFGVIFRLITTGLHRHLLMLLLLMIFLLVFQVVFLSVVVL